MFTRAINAMVGRKAVGTIDHKPQRSNAELKAMAKEIGEMSKHAKWIALMEKYKNTKPTEKEIDSLFGIDSQSGEGISKVS